MQNDSENIHKTLNQNNIKLLVLNYKLWPNTNLMYSVQDLLNQCKHSFEIILYWPMLSILKSNMKDKLYKTSFLSHHLL